MRIVPIPEFAIEDVYDSCVGGVGNARVRERFELYKNQIIESANEYRQKALNSNLYLITPYGSNDAITVPIVTKKELMNLYSYQMAKLERPGRSYYDVIKASARGLCPFCGISSPRTLDHFLPKAHYLNLSVLPINLVPACRDCNTEKHDKKITQIEEQKIHPYFDNFTNEQWLFADVINAGTPVVIFKVIPPEHWELKDQCKVNSHLSTYDLVDRYGDLATNEISGIKNQMANLFFAGGLATLKSELKERAESHAENHLNSWQVALYQALADSDWYCDGGFNTIG